MEIEREHCGLGVIYRIELSVERVGDEQKMGRNTMTRAKTGRQSLEPPNADQT